MREIKFRIWDGKRKEWVHDTDHAVNLLGETIIMGEILRRPDDGHVLLSELNDLVVMQFTGLKDKNGVDIYDGDVIRYDDSEYMSHWVAGEKALIINMPGRFTARMSPFDKFTGGNQNMLTEDFQDSVEVIGNIHQNPELCKK